MRKEIVNKTDVLVDIAIQICSAMKYLEVNHFIHRDLVSGLECVGWRWVGVGCRCVCGVWGGGGWL